MNQEIAKQLLATSGINRRDALKLIALLPTLAAASTQNNNNSPTNFDKVSIAIVGAGAGGISVAARLSKELPNATITIIDKNERHLYQPGQTLVAAGVYKFSEIQKENSELIPNGVLWEKSNVNEFDPETNALYLENGKKIKYDFLVVATGLVSHFENIPGLSRKMIGEHGIASIYDPIGATRTFSLIQNNAKKSNSQKVNALFTQPNSPLKCAGAPKKILFLAHDYIRNNGIEENCNFEFLPDSSQLIGVDPFEKALTSQFEERKIKTQFHSTLLKVDPIRQEATFKQILQSQGEWDDHINDYETIYTTVTNTKPYDFLHVTPPMSAPSSVKNSSLAWQKGNAMKHGLIEVNQYTLQHKRYDNIFSLGDVIGTPIGKTGGSVRMQVPIVVANINNAIQNKDLSAKYSGYTVCPIITGYGSVMMAEFDYEGLASSISWADPTSERWLWWLIKVYALKPLYFYGMLKGLA
jgi:sulfide:quinone oxidoreductase